MIIMAIQYVSNIHAHVGSLQYIIICIHVRSLRILAINNSCLSLFSAKHTCPYRVDRSTYKVEKKV